MLHEASADRVDEENSTVRSSDMSSQWNIASSHSSAKEENNGYQDGKDH
jgi:hypothetical protein